MSGEKLGGGRLSFLAPPSHLTGGEAFAKAVRSPPSNVGEWLDFAVHMLSTITPETATRALETCVEASSVIIETADAIHNGASAGNEGAMFSPAEGAEESYARGASGRKQAARLLIAGSIAATDCGDLTEAVKLAQLATEAFHCPMTASALAWANMRQCALLPETGMQGAARVAAVAAASSGAAMLLEGGDIPADEMPYLVRMMWVLACLGEAQMARVGVNKLLQADPTHYTGLLLLSLLHTASADYGSALIACQHGLACYPDDICIGLLFVTIGYVSAHQSSTSINSKEAAVVAEELAVLLARVKQYAEYANGMDSSTNRRRTLQCLSTRYAPGEEGDNALSAHEVKLRAASYWALLADICIRLGAHTVADLAIEAGLDFVAVSTTFYRKPFADLLCSRARLALTHARERMPRKLQSRELNLLGSLKPAAQPAPDIGNMYSIQADVRGGEEQTADLSDASKLLSSRELVAIFTYLLKAAEICPGHADAHYMMGTIRLMEASQPDLLSSARADKYSEAAHYYMNALQCAPLTSAPYVGLGCVREAEGATEVALDMYASAAEIQLDEPLIPAASLSFLFGV